MPRPGRSGARQRVQGSGRDAGQRGACAGPQYQPTAVSLDMFLPDMLGWTVLSQLKQDPATRHIPVQIITLDEDRQHGLARGAFASSPSPPPRRALQDVFVAHQGISPCRAASACWWSRTILPSR